MSAMGDVVIAISRTPALAVLVKATVLFALGLSAAALATRASASVRHLLLAATFAAVLALPLAATWAPAVNVRVHSTPPAASPTVSATSDVAVPVIAQGGATSPSTSPSAFAWPSLARLLPAIWILGAVAALAPLLPMALCTRRLRRSALPWPGPRPSAIPATRSIQLLRHEDVASPITFGWWRPAILMPADSPSWNGEDVRRAVVHEIEHVRRHDWLVQLAARLACAMYWFHPLAWAAWRRLGLEAERACDDAVVLRADAADYAEQLVTLAERGSPALAAGVVGMARRSDLAQRVTSLLDPVQRRGRAGLPVRLLAGTAALVLLGVVSPLRAVGTAATAAGDESAPRSAWLRQIDAGLYDAAEEGDLAGIDELIGLGANVDAVILGDGSPLLAAARNGHLEAVRALLDRGANPDLPVPGDGSALIAAAGRDHAAVVALLLDRGAAVDQVVDGDENALIQASGAGALATARLLVERGADVNARVLAPTVRGREWRSPLGQARRGRHTDVVALLERAGARE